MMGKHLYIMVDLHYMMSKHLYIMVDLHYMLYVSFFFFVHPGEVPVKPRPRVYKPFFMLTSAETKIYPAHKC